MEVALLGAGAPTLYLSDRRISVAGQEYEPCIEGISGINSETRRLDSASLNPSVRISFLNDPHGASGEPLIMLGETYPFDAAGVTIKEVYLDADWTPGTPAIVFRGVLDPPHEIGRLRFVCMCSSLEADKAERFSDPVLTETEYPQAFEDLGRNIPLVYGSDLLLPTLRIDWSAVTTLKEDLDETTNNFGVTDSTRFPSTGTLIIDGEEMNYSSKGSDAFGLVTRGVNGTTATKHGTGAVVWERKTYYKALAAAHALKQVKAVYAEVDGHLVTVPPASWQPSVVNGRTEIQLSEAFKVSAKDSYTVVDGISVKTNSVDTSEEYTEVQAYASEFTCRLYQDHTGLPYTTQVIDTIYFPPAPSGTLSEIELEVAFGIDAGSGAGWSPYDEYYFYINGVKVGTFNQGWIDARLDQHKSSPIVFRLANWITSVQYQIVRYRPDGNYGITDVRMNMTKSALRCKRTVAKVGTVTLDGGVFYTRFADRIHALVDGAQDDASGTFTGVPYGVIERPGHAVRHFLQQQMGYSTSDMDLAAFSAAAALYVAAGYKFGFVTMDGVGDPSAFVRSLVRQARSVLRFGPSQWRLDYLPDAAPASVKTIDAGEVYGEHAELIFRRGLRQDIKNHYKARHTENYGPTRHESRWNATAEASDASSISVYGDRVKALDLWAVRSAAMAQHVINHMLLQTKFLPLRVSMELAFEHSDLGPGDTITLTGPLFGGRQWYIEETRHDNPAPGTVTIEAVEWWA